MNYKMPRKSKKQPKNVCLLIIKFKLEIIESYFQGQHLERLVRHQTESYNNFVNY